MPHLSKSLHVLYLGRKKKRGWASFIQTKYILLWFIRTLADWMQIINPQKHFHLLSIMCSFLILQLAWSASLRESASDIIHITIAKGANSQPAEPCGCFGQKEEDIGSPSPNGWRWLSVTDTCAILNSGPVQKTHHTCLSPTCPCHYSWKQQDYNDEYLQHVLWLCPQNQLGKKAH